MGFSDVWNRTLVYFGIAEDEDWDEDGIVTQESSIANIGRARRDRTSGACLGAGSPTRGRTTRERGGRAVGRSAAVEPLVAAARLRGVDASRVSVHLVLPRSFNDAQQIADKFKDSVPVILNLQSADNELSKRLIDFASGLTYALDGSMQRVADKVFLLTPRNVEVSAEERARMIDKGGFFNQA